MKGHKGWQKYLKKKPSGPWAVGLLKQRTQFQIETPKDDALSRAVYHDLMEVLPSLSGTLLDVGCYGGWLYHFVKDRVDYHGIDLWPEAIQTAKELFPPERFTVSPLESWTTKADIVWATQLHPEMNRGEFLPLLAGLANKRVFWTEQQADYSLTRNLFTEVIEHGILREGVIGQSLSER